MAHFCAGEDLAHPEIADRAPGPLPCAPQPRYLPRPLVIARARVFHPHAVMDLDRPARRVLYGLLAFYSLKDPSAPIFAYRETLMAEALVGSLATLYRGLKTLESKGYIERRQGRVRQGPEFGQYERSRVWLTLKARTLLELLPADLHRDQVATCLTAHRRDRAAAYPHRPSIRVRDGIRKKQRAPEVDLLQPLSEEQPATSARAKPAVAPAGVSKKLQKPRATVPGVPERLAFLVTRHRLPPSGVFKLMAVAKAHGKAGQVEVVAAAAGSTFAQLRGRDAFAYLAKLLRQEKDFAYVARVKQEDARLLRTAEAVRTLATSIPAFAERFSGCEVLRADGTSVGVLTPMGASYWVRGAGGVLPLNARTMRLFEDGVLKIGQGPAATETWTLTGLSHG